MRVGMYYRNSDVRLEQMPKPEAGEGEILLKVIASGICGTDIIEWYRIHRAPLVLGHEVAGEITKTGPGVTKYKIGDRIAVSHHVPCGSCRFCLSGHETACDTLRKTNFFPGGFSEYVRVPKINVEKGVYPIADEVSYEEATFAEPLACVLRGQKISGVKAGDSVLVIGSGISGLLHIKLAKARGVKKVFATDLSDFRLKAAERFGADFVFRAKDFNPEDIKPLNDNFLADKVLVCTGAESALRQALKSVERGGTVLFFACTDKGITIPLSINDVFWRNDITLTTSYAGSPEDHLEALELIKSGRVKVKDMITHRFSLAEIQEGFGLVREAKESIKVIIEPQKKG
ncbi:MAG: zinc-dependent dehydrogenase [Candidatus Omnitrophica bacterium]|nr:zinc-dependent dehydrogenase [Candidatus Omnitrophota bacterium]